MRRLQYLLIFYAFFIILIGPALHMAGVFFNVHLISSKEYFIAVIFFIAGLIIYTQKDKKAV